MAELNAPPAAEAPIRALQQFGAIASLRWHLFRNAFRRKGSQGELVARIVVIPVAALFLLGPSAACFALSYAAVSGGNLDALKMIFAGVFVLQILVSINISPPSLSFTPEALIRYPLSFPRYLTIRLFLGLLSTSTVVGTSCLLAAAGGISAAHAHLAAIAFSAALALALTHMLFTRMLFAWVDRWLATRRAREIFTLLVFVFSIGIQYVNVTINNFGHRDSHAQQQARIEAATRLLHHAQHALILLPPGLAGAAVQSFSRGATGLAVGEIAAVLLYALLFFSVLARRLEREYRGENLSEASVPASRTATPMPIAPVASARRGTFTAMLERRLRPWSVLLGCLHKEWIYVRRNPSQLYGLLAPLAMIFLFAGRMSSVARTGMVFPAGAAYALLGIAALAYNLFGTDAEGVQFYFLAPIEMRSVVLAKNLFGFCVTALQLALLYGMLAFTSRRPPLLTTVITICWIVFAALLNVTIGNIRSITAPRKVDPGKVSRKQASPLSALISVGAMLGAAAFGAGLLALGGVLGKAWLPIPVLLACDAGAVAVYVRGMRRVDGLALSHREMLFEELAKTSV